MDHYTKAREMLARHVSHAGSFVANADVVAPHDVIDEIAALLAREADSRAEVDALREDAERYRWLRSADNDVAPMIRPNGIGWQMLCGTRLDAAIDAARKAAATPPDAKGTMAQTGE